MQIHDHKEALRSSNELFTGERESDSSEGTCAFNSIKETCHESSRQSHWWFFQQKVTPGVEQKWSTIDVLFSTSGGLPSKVSKMVSKMVCRQVISQNGDRALANDCLLSAKVSLESKAAVPNGTKNVTDVERAVRSNGFKSGRWYSSQ